MTRSPTANGCKLHHLPSCPPDRSLRKFLLAILCAAIFPVAAVLTNAQVNPTKGHAPASATPLRSLSGSVGQEGRNSFISRSIPADKYTAPKLDVRFSRKCFASPPPTTICTNWWERLRADLTLRVTRNPQPTRPSYRNSEGFFRSRQKRFHLPDADLQRPGLVGRQEYRTRDSALHRPPWFEHLGQSIAYSRVLGITPPWTEDAQKKQPEKK